MYQAQVILVYLKCSDRDIYVSQGRLFHLDVVLIGNFLTADNNDNNNNKAKMYDSHIVKH